jgi:hypothetical protein
MAALPLPTETEPPIPTSRTPVQRPAAAGPHGAIRRLVRELRAGRPAAPPPAAHKPVSRFLATAEPRITNAVSPRSVPCSPSPQATRQHDGSRQTARIIDLQRGELLRLDAARGARLQVLYGAIWLTEPQRLDDVFAASGDEVVLDHGGHVLVEAQRFARVILPAPAGFGGALARFAAALRRLLPVPAPATT